MKDSEICRKAAGLIQTHGLAAEIRLDVDGSMCVLGALAAARYDSAQDTSIDYHPVLRKLVSLLSLPPSPFHSHYAWRESWQLADWSNTAARERKPEVVINGLRKVADILETQERTEA